MALLDLLEPMKRALLGSSEAEADADCSVQEADAEGEGTKAAVHLGRRTRPRNSCTQPKASAWVFAFLRPAMKSATRTGPRCSGEARPSARKSSACRVLRCRRWAGRGRPRPRSCHPRKGLDDSYAPGHHPDVCESASTISMFQGANPTPIRNQSTRSSQTNRLSALIELRS